jgi:aspartate/tyrosine/aromatic aminotransferase
MKITKRQLKRIIKEEYSRLIREGMHHSSQNLGADVLDLASRPEGVSLDELMEKLGSAAFDEVDRLAEEGIVFLDDQEGVVYASGSQPSAGLEPAIRRYTGR